MLTAPPSISSIPGATNKPATSLAAARIFWVIFLALALGITWSCRESFFGTPIYEEGDDAANALQIYRAKSLRELHGNYSRWGFHHPGPAFFYAYAAGEVVLHDWLKIAPAPRNAHVYVGTLLQLAFYAAAITLLARHTRQPLLAAALALAAGAVHYAQVERVIYSIWPPDVLLMPFLCFTTACAALAVGDRLALPIVVLAGGFLVHGHIAQPLFVGPMALLAGAGAWRRWRGDPNPGWRSREAIVALGLLVLFLLPLGLDLLRGRHSNAHDVLLHLRFQSDRGQSLLNALLCYGSYFIGLNDPTMFTTLTATSHVPFAERWWWLAGWLTTLAFCAGFFFRKRREPGEDRRFGRSLIGFWFAGSALTLVWGMRQDGGFTFFNSHFNHSLVHAIAFAAILALTHVLPRASRGFGWFAVAAGALAFAATLPYAFEPGSRGDEVASRLPGLLHADPKPNAPKLITFEGDSWYEAVTLARAFQRLDIPFYVHPQWRFMFGDDHVLKDPRMMIIEGGVSVWQVRPAHEPPTGAHTLNRESAVVFPEPSTLVRLPAHFDFSANDHRRYTLFGIGPGEEASAWTDAKIAVLSLAAPATEDDIMFECKASGFISHLTPRGQRVTVWVNGKLLGQQLVGSQTRSMRFVIPRDVWNDRSPRTIVFDLPDATAPATAGRSDDRRELGLSLSHLSLVPLEH